MLSQKIIVTLRKILYVDGNMIPLQMLNGNGILERHPLDKLVHRSTTLLDKLDMVKLIHLLTQYVSKSINSSIHTIC